MAINTTIENISRIILYLSTCDLVSIENTSQTVSENNDRLTIILNTNKLIDSANVIIFKCNYFL